MRASDLTLLLVLLVQVSVRGESGEWCTSSLASVDFTKTAWGDGGYTARLWDFSVHGHLNSTPAARGLFSGVSPTRFALSFRHAETSGVVSGSLYLSNDQVPVSAVTAKGWNPRFHRSYRRPTERGSFTGLFNLTSKSLCANVCFRSANATEKYCGYLLSLEYPLEKTLDNLFVNGNIRSLLPATDVNYVAPMTLVGATRGNYTFTKLEESEKVCAASEPGLSSAVSGMSGNTTICYTGLENVDLNITSNATCGKQACYPFADDGGSGSRSVLFEGLECERDGRVHGFLRLFHDLNRFTSRFTGGANTLAVEGKWSGNKLCMVGCQTSGSSPRDCSIQLTLQFPLEFSIHQRSPVVATLSSQRNKTDPLFFEPLALGAESQMFRFYNHAPGNFTYLYSKTKEAEQLCNTGKVKKGEVFPSGYYFQDLFFSGRAGTEDFHVYPVSLDEKLPWYVSSAVVSFSSPAGEVREPVKRMINVSFDIRIGGEYIAAEGVYDSSRGTVCMIGCQTVNETNSDLDQGKDCKISVKVRYPPLLAESRKRQTTMTITSLRGKKDALYFKPKTLSSYQSIYLDEASQSLWLKDLEIFLSMLTLSMVLVVLTFQLVHARRQPKLRPYASLVMLSILVLGHMVPLVLNFEALFSRTSASADPVVASPAGDGSFLQVKEVAIRLMNMAVFLLLLWLFHLVWNSRQPADGETSAAELSTFGESSRLLDEGKTSPAEEEQKTLPPPASYPLAAVREKNVLLVCMPLYVVGALATSIRQVIVGKSLWSGLKAYAGLTLDFFLVPQVLAYFVWGVKVPALSPAFYVGMTLARLLPHGFDIYRTLKPSFNAETDVFFANPDWDFFSLAWDIAIPCGALLVAAVVFVQQRYGGRFSNGS